jgi:hypothetical protein
MKNSHVIFVVITAFIIGGVIGAYIEHCRFTRIVSNIEVSDQFGHVVDAYIALRDLRRGETNGAFEQLELQLDDAVVSLSLAMDKHPSVECATNYSKFLKTVANYRATYPHHNEDTNEDAVVTAALAKITKNRNH